MNDPIPTIPLGDALDTPAPDGVVPGPAPAPASAERVRFVKTMSPGDPVRVLGIDISFHIPRNNQTGELCSYGYYDTADPAMIEALRGIVKDQSVLYVRET